MTPRGAIPRTIGEPPALSHAGVPFVEGPAGWRTRAACRGMDPDVFFTRRGDNAGVRAAKAVCAGCPVAEHCAAYGFVERQGVWGGVSEKSRRARRRDMTTLTKNELLKARGQDPAATPVEEPPAAPPESDTPRCRHCHKQLPAGHHRIYCDDSCMHAHDRDSRRSRTNGKAKPKHTAGARADKPAAPGTNGARANGSRTNGLKPLLADLLELGNIELELRLDRTHGVTGILVRTK